MSVEQWLGDIERSFSLTLDEGQDENMLRPSGTGKVPLETPMGPEDDIPNQQQEQQQQQQQQQEDRQQQQQHPSASNPIMPSHDIFSQPLLNNGALTQDMMSMMIDRLAAPLDLSSMPLVGNLSDPLVPFSDDLLLMPLSTAPTNPSANAPTPSPSHHDLMMMMMMPAAATLPLTPQQQDVGTPTTVATPSTAATFNTSLFPSLPTPLSAATPPNAGGSSFTGLGAAFSANPPSLSPLPQTPVYAPFSAMSAFSPMLQPPPFGAPGLGFHSPLVGPDGVGNGFAPTELESSEAAMTAAGVALNASLLGGLFSSMIDKSANARFD
ncbi:hypothetical protein HK101_002414, partial [Irineochytrium annulatum]